MEPEKPRFVSIPAETAVVSDKPRVSISAARPVAAAAADAFLLTRNLSGSFSSGSFPIRAPITIDEDDDSGSVTDEHNSASSEASSYSRGLDSGTDDGFESVSREAENEPALEDLIMGGIRVHRLLGEVPGGETGDGSDFSGGSVIYRPFAGDMDEETSVNYSSLEEESENSDEVEGVSESEVSEADRVSMKAKVVIPRAILSLDDDEFDEILGSDDEEAVLLRVTKSQGDEETQVEDRTLQFGDMAIVDEPKCSESIIGELASIEEETVRMSYSEKLDHCLMSFENLEEPSLGVPQGGCNEYVAENEEASMGLGLSSKQLIEKGVAQRTNIKEGGCSIYEVGALMKLGDVGEEDCVVELGEMGMTDKLEYSGSVTGSAEEDLVQMKVSDNGLVSSETSLGFVPGNCNEFLVESEGNAVDADQGLNENLSQLVEQRVGKGSISKERDNSVDDGSACEADDSMILGDGSIGLRSRESGDEDSGNMTDEPQERFENDCSSVSEVDKPECEGEPEIGMSYDSFQVTPTLNSATTRNEEVDGEVDVVVSGCGCSDQKAEQESENEENQESEDIDRILSLPDEDVASSLRRSFETANENMKNGEQISEQMNRQVKFHSNSEPNQISVGIEETSLLSVIDVERTMPENTPVTVCDIMENETRLVHNHSLKEFDEYEGTGKELSSDHSVQLISERVKERIEKTQLLKAKLERIIRRRGLCNENSAVTGVVSKLGLASQECQTSLGLDYLSNRRKIRLPEQEFQDDLDSINVLVIGKTGVGKSATVNAIFGETKSAVGGFGVTTKTANYVVGNVGGILVRILDTPGLKSSATEERFNQKVLISIKKSMRTFPVDVILYINRLDEHPEIHLLRIITSSLGSSIWLKAIVVLTHAASNVPDCSSYKDFIAQRCSLMHQSIRKAVPEHSKMPEIVLAENNMSSFCGNETEESTCVDWRLNLVKLCCSVKMRSKANSLEKPDVLGSVTIFCSLWNVLLHGANPGNAPRLHDDLEEKKKKRLLDSYPEILWDELNLETTPMTNQEPIDEEKEVTNGVVVGRVRRRKGGLGFQATKRFGIYLDTCDLRTGFSIGDYRKHEEQGRILVRMKDSMAVLGFVPMLVSVYNSVYGRKDV